MQTGAEKAYHFEGFTLDLSRGSLSWADQEIELRPKSFEMLRHLVENAGRLVGKDELAKLLWRNVAVSDESLTHCISDIRLALRDSARRLIRTVPRRGYRFVASVTQVELDQSKRAPAPLADHMFRGIETAIARTTLALIWADIAGTSRLIAEQGDLVAASALQEFFERAGKLGKDHHCFLTKFIGDGFLAAFEATGDVLPFVSAVQTLLETHPVFRIHRLGCRFSLHFGAAICIKTSYGYDVFGDEVNVVAHMCHLAQPGEMVVSCSALAAMPSELQVKIGKSEWGRVRAGDIEFYRVALVAC